LAYLAGVFAAVIIIDARQAAYLVLLFIYGGYRIIATVGVWRSSSEYANKFAKAGLSTGKVVAFFTKIFVCIVVIGDIGRFTGVTLHDLIKLL